MDGRADENKKNIKDSLIPWQFEFVSHPLNHDQVGGLQIKARNFCKHRIKIPHANLFMTFSQVFWGRINTGGKLSWKEPPDDLHVVFEFLAKNDQIVETSIVVRKNVSAQSEAV